MKKSLGYEVQYFDCITENWLPIIEYNHKRKRLYYPTGNAANEAMKARKKRFGHVKFRTMEVFK